MFSIRFALGIYFRKRWPLLLKSPYSLSGLGELRVSGSAASTETCSDEPSLPVPQLHHYFCGMEQAYAYFVPWCYFEIMVINNIVSCGQDFSLWGLHWKALSWYSPGRGGHRSSAYIFRNIVPWSYQKYIWGYLTFHMEISLQMILLTDKV